MLAGLLCILIVVTLVCWAVPLLFFPGPILRKLRVPLAEPLIVLRLLGAVNLALCLIYLLGSLRLSQGHNATDVVMVGLLHSAMAAAIIWRYALHGHYRRWPAAARGYIFTSGSILTTLALALLVAGLWYG